MSRERARDWLLLLRARARLPQDIPNERSLHVAPLPRGGGIAIWAGLAAGRAVVIAGRDSAALDLWLVPWLAAGAGFPARRRAARSAWACGCWCTRWPRSWLRCRAGAATRRGDGVVVRRWLPVGAAGGRDRRVVAQSLQFHGWQRRAGRGDDRSLGFSAYGVGAVAARARLRPPSSRWRRRRCRSSSSTCPPSRMIMGDVGAVPLGFLAAAFGVALVVDGSWPALVSAARVPALHRGRDDHARCDARGAARGSGRRIACTTTSGCTGWAPGHRGTLAVYGAAGWPGPRLTRAGLPALANPRWAGRRWSPGASPARRCSRQLIIIGGSKFGTVR